MGRVFSKGQLIVFGMLLLVIIFSVIIRSCSKQTVIRASVSPLIVEEGASIRFADSTYGASEVLWEFGNDDVSHEKVGNYTYGKAGRYQIRLTVDKKMTQNFIVNVKESKSKKDKELVSIKVDTIVMQDQQVIFMAVGESDNWRWEFGESGKIDSHEKNPIHAYAKPGVYEVKLMADRMMYPAICRVKVLPKFVPFDIVTHNDNFDFKEKLQNIIDFHVFNKYYNYLTQRYLSRKIRVPVLINGEKENDFYQYCQGLYLLGKQQSIVIMDVNLEYDKNKRVKRVIVQQTSVE